jgi:hypothetical protein
MVGKRDVDGTSPNAASTARRRTAARLRRHDGRCGFDGTSTSGVPMVQLLIGRRGGGGTSADAASTT